MISYGIIIVPAPMSVRSSIRIECGIRPSMMLVFLNHSAGYNALILEVGYFAYADYPD